MNLLHYMNISTHSSMYYYTDHKFLMKEPKNKNKKKNYTKGKDIYVYDSMVVRRSRRSKLIVLLVVIVVIFLTLDNKNKSGWNKKIQTSLKIKKGNGAKDEYSNDSNKGMLDFENTLMISDAMDSGIAITANYERANATFYSFFKSSELGKMLTTVQSVESRFNHDLHYDWVFVSNRRINDVSKKLLSNSVSGNSIFYQIPSSSWAFPSNVDRSKASKLRRKSRLYKITTGVSDQLRFKLRYHAGLFQMSPPLRRYKYYMRIDPGLVFQCDVTADFFKEMESQRRKFGFVRAGKDVLKAVDTLWESTEKYFSDLTRVTSDNTLKKFFINDNDGSYDPCYLSSNLQIMDLDFLRSQNYLEFFKYLDSLSGWFYERWTDYHIHSLLSFLLLSPDEIKFFNLSYSDGEDMLVCAMQELQYISQNCYCDQTMDKLFTNGAADDDQNQDSQCMQKLISLMPSDQDLQKLTIYKQEKFELLKMLIGDDDLDNDQSLYNKVKQDKEENEVEDAADSENNSNAIQEEQNEE